MAGGSAVFPGSLVINGDLQRWLLEDIGRGDRTTQGLLTGKTVMGQADWIAKAPGTLAGLAIAGEVFHLLSDRVCIVSYATDGEVCDRGQTIAKFQGPCEALLTGERVALNLAMRLSGIATLTRQYVERIADFSTQLVDTRKTTPGLRVLEKYAMQVGGACNHRMGLDDAVMIKDNHIAIAGGIEAAIAQIRPNIPYPLSIEVETQSLAEVEAALRAEADIIMLDNMTIEMMTQAVKMIRQACDRTKIEASGNITLETLRTVAATGVDYISTSAPITRSNWLDLSMNLKIQELSN